MACCKLVYMYILVTLFVVSRSILAMLDSTIPNVKLHELTESEIEHFTANFTVITADAPKLSGKNKTLCFCGTSNTPRDAGGVEAHPSEFPWMVYLTIKKGTKLYFCGGFLITNKHVLTTASCTLNADEDGVTVYLGNHNGDVAAFETPAIQVAASNILIHPQFNRPYLLNNDIAIVKLQYTVTFAENIRPICLPPKQFNFDFVNSKTIVAGWGASLPNGSLTNVLRKSTVPVISNEECQNLYKNATSELIITLRMLCGGEEGNNVCRGDEGGPLMISFNSRYYAAGIVSFDLGCESPYHPGIYTRLTKYRSFINKYTANALMCH